MIGLFAPAKACGAEKDYCVLDLLAAEPRQGFQKLRHNPDETPVGAVQESGILIGKRSAFQWWRRSVSGNHGARLDLRSGCRRRNASVVARLHLLPRCRRTCVLFFVVHISTVPAANGVLKRNP